MSADLTLRALDRVRGVLQARGIPHALMGGLAVVAWKHARFTQDVDLLIGIGSSDPQILIEQLGEADCRVKRQPGVVRIGQTRFIQLLCEPPGAYLEVQIDLLIADSEYQREALARRVAAELEGVGSPVDVLACEDLILHKLLAGRVIDRADAAALLRANREDLDLGYLLRWIGDLDLRAELCEIWDEAFPGEQPPAESDPSRT